MPPKALNCPVSCVSYRILALLLTASLWRSGWPSSHASPSLRLPSPSSSTHRPKRGISLPPFSRFHLYQRWFTNVSCSRYCTRPHSECSQPQQGTDTGQVPALHRGLWDRSVRWPGTSGSAQICGTRGRNSRRGNWPVRSLWFTELWGEQCWWRSSWEHHWSWLQVSEMMSSYLQAWKQIWTPLRSGLQTLCAAVGG